MAEMKGDPAEAARAVLAFWFGEIGRERWWAKDAGLDAAITARFGALRDAVLASGARGWRDDPETLLGAIILCDQFSRNIHRDNRSGRLVHIRKLRNRTPVTYCCSRKSGYR
jgi:uncharacterized protein (DUF924 family)